MNWYWVWTSWLLFLIVSFAALEGYAISKTDGVTLSQFTAEVSAAWPLMPWVLGVLAGGLAVHFFWHWQPKIVGVSMKALFGSH
jgi:hypothetical protein